MSGDPVAYGQQAGGVASEGDSQGYGNALRALSQQQQLLLLGGAGLHRWQSGQARDADLPGLVEQRSQALAAESCERHAALLALEIDMGSDPVIPELQPCLLCHSTEALCIEHGAGSLYGTEVRCWILCTACQLRGPWRPSEAAARAAWNRHVTVDQDAAEAAKE